MSTYLCRVRCRPLQICQILYSNHPVQHKDLQNHAKTAGGIAKATTSPIVASSQDIGRPCLGRLAPSRSRYAIIATAAPTTPIAKKEVPLSRTGTPQPWPETFLVSVKTEGQRVSTTTLCWVLLRRSSYTEHVFEAQAPTAAFKAASAHKHSEVRLVAHVELGISSMKQVNWLIWLATNA